MNSSPEEGKAADTARAAVLRPERKGRVAWKKMLAFGLALLALRMAVPLLLAPLIAARLSRVVGARVEIGDVSLNPLDAVVTLRNLALYPPSRPHPPLQADQVRIDLQWLPLLHKTLRVRELTLESGYLDVRLQDDGKLSVPGIATPNPASELPAGWRFALDRVSLRNARLRVYDADPESASLEATIHNASFAGNVTRPEVFGKATNMSVDASIGGGRLRFDGHYDLGDEGLSFDAHSVMRDVPLQDVFTHLTARESTDLSGTMSAKLRWRREPGRLDTVSGRVVLRDVRVQVAGLDEPAFSAKRGVAEISAVELARRKITVQSLSLRRATLAVRPDATAPVPLLTTLLASTAEPRLGNARSQRAAPQPWSWTIKRFDTSSARLRILSSGDPVEVRAHANGENIGNQAYWSPLRVELEHGDIDAAFDGALRLTGSPPLEGRLTAEGLDFAPLARGAGLPWAELVQQGRAAVDLTVGFDATAGEESPFYARGAIILSDLWLAEGEPGGLNLATDRVALNLAGFSLAESGRTTAANGHRPRVIRFTEAALEAPVAQLLRKRDGALLLPAPTATATDLGETPEIVFDTIRISGGELTFVDLMPSPSVTWQVAQINASARAAVSSAIRWDKLRVRGNDRRFGTFEVTAAHRGDATAFELRLPNVRLAAMAPYMSHAGIPFRFAAGLGSVTAAGSIGAENWEAETTVVLREPSLSDADDLQRIVGMPIGDALQRLRDERGDITLRTALASPHAGRPSNIENIAAALRAAIASAEKPAAEPETETFSAVSVLFQPGSSEFGEAGRRDLAPLAALLASRSDLVVELSADTSRADRRWLAEQALRAILDEKQGLKGLLRAIGFGRDRDRIKEALAARANGAPGTLDKADQELLEKLLAEAPPIDESRLAELRKARLQVVSDYLSTAADTASARLILRPDPSRGGIALSVVRAQAALPAAPKLAGTQEPSTRE